MPNRVAVLWPGRPVPLPLDPLLLYREGELADEVLFLNRDRNGRQVEYLSYTTGRTERDRATAPALAALLGRITGREVGEDQLQALAEQSAAETPSVEALFGPPPPAARQLGDYEILAEIGRGGMGVVYLARQLSLGRLVALEDAAGRPGGRRGGAGPVPPRDAAAGAVRAPEHRQGAGQRHDARRPALLRDGVRPRLRPGAGLARALRLASTRGTPRRWAAAPGPAPSCRPAARSASRRPGTGSSGGRLTRRRPSPTEPVPPLPLPPLPELPSAPDDPGGYARRVATLVRDAALALAGDPRPAGGPPRRQAGQPDADARRLAGGADGLRAGQGPEPVADGQPAGGLLGTLRYAAPEQLAAASLKVGPAADVRGLGVTLWELLTRRRLFAEAEDERQLAALVHDQDVPRLRTIDPSLDRDLEAIVARATERRAADRIATAGQLGRSTCSSTSTASRCRSGRRRRPRWWVAGSAATRPWSARPASATLAILVTVVTAFVLITRSRDNEKTAKNEANRAPPRTRNSLRRTGASLRTNEGKGSRPSERLASLYLERGQTLCNAGGGRIRGCSGWRGALMSARTRRGCRSATDHPDIIGSLGLPGCQP